MTEDIMANDNYRLCYVDKNILYFTDNFESQWGDDWDDAPYEYNAEPPYSLADDEPLRDGYGHIRYIAFMSDDRIRRPYDGHLNSPYSVSDINKGAVAWLYNKDFGGLIGGATMDEAIKWFECAKIRWGELK